MTRVPVTKRTNFNPSMDKWSRAELIMDEITYIFSNFTGCTVEVWEGIINFIPHFIMGVIT